MKHQFTRAHRLCSIAALLLAFAGPAAAAPARPAHDPMPKGTFVLGAERLFGLSVNTTTTATDAGDRSVSHTGFSLLLSSPTTVYMRPRVSLDVAVADGLTVGGAFGLFVGDREDSATAGDTTTSAEGPTTKALLIAPRVGYALGLGHTLSLWPRAGLTYFSTGSESEHAAGGTVTTTSARTSGVSLNLEPALLVAPFTNFGFTAALVADLPLTGKLTRETRTETAGVTRTTTNDTDQKLRNLGVVVGMAGIF